MVSPRADSERTTSSTSPSRRCRFLTITGSNVPSRSRGTSISTGPVAAVSTVFERDPLRMLAEPRPTSARFFSCPRCSVISSLNAVSSTFLVNCLSSPSGPVSDKPRSLASFKNSRAASASAEGLFVLALTSPSVESISVPLPLDTPSESGRKHR